MWQRSQTSKLQASLKNWKLCHMRCRLKYYKHLSSYTYSELPFPSIILLYLLSYAISKLLKRSVSENEPNFILFGVDNYASWMKNTYFSKPILTMIQMLLLNHKSCKQFSLWMCEKLEALPWKGNWFNLGPVLPPFGCPFSPWLQR